MASTRARARASVSVRPTRWRRSAGGTAARTALPPRCHSEALLVAVGGGRDRPSEHRLKVGLVERPREDGGCRRHCRRARRVLQQRALAEGAAAPARADDAAVDRVRARAVLDDVELVAVALALRDDDGARRERDRLEGVEQEPLLRRRRGGRAGSRRTRCGRRSTRRERRLLREQRRRRRGRAAADQLCEGPRPSSRGDPARRPARRGLRSPSAARTEGLSCPADGADAARRLRRGGASAERRFGPPLSAGAAVARRSMGELRASRKSCAVAQLPLPPACTISESRLASRSAFSSPPPARRGAGAILQAAWDELRHFSASSPWRPPRATTSSARPRPARRVDARRGG